MMSEGTMSSLVPSRNMTQIVDTFAEKCLPRVVQALQELDPDVAYAEAGQASVDGVRIYLQNLIESERTGGTLRTKDYRGNPMFRLRDLVGKRIHELAKLKIPLEVPWGHLTGFCMSVPVCDGEHVYASFGQGQTVCYDLDGRRRWGVSHEQDQKFSYLSVVHSPLLADDILVDMHGGGRVLRGLDKRTGHDVWEAPTAVAKALATGGYAVGSHKVVSLGEGRRREKFIVTAVQHHSRVRWQINGQLALRTSTGRGAVDRRPGRYRAQGHRGRQLPHSLHRLSTHAGG